MKQIRRLFGRRGDTPSQSSFSPPARHIIDIPYALPTDEGEISRLDFQHFMLRYVNKGNFLAPLRNPQQILDIGTGTGRWAIEMAQQFPQAIVIAIDPNEMLSESLVNYTENASRQPPDNYHFFKGNVLEGLTMGQVPIDSDQFDFTHQRLLIAAIPHDEWPQVIAELVRVTKPGGYIELVEAQFCEGGGPILEQLNTWGFAVCQRLGIDLRDAKNLGTIIQHIGLPYQEHTVVVPMCAAKHGRVATMMKKNYLSAVSAMEEGVVRAGLKFIDTKTYGTATVTRQQFRDFVELASLEIDDVLLPEAVSPYYYYIIKR